MSTAEPSDSSGRVPISPAKRQVYQAWFQHGSKNSAQGNFDYATEMFTNCVKGDPGNAIYVQNFLGNLHKKYNNNKKGGKLSGIRGATTRTSATKAKLQKNWGEVINQGLELLKLNPWDTSALADVAAACDHLGYDDAQIVYLKAAVDADLRDPETNRLLARALAKGGQFDNAIGCWNRVLAARPNDEEAQRAISHLTAEKTIHKGGYEDAQTSTDVMADKQAQAERQGASVARGLTPEQQLEKAIAKDLTNTSKYLELAELHQREEKWDKAEAVLNRALSASGGDVALREKLEDLQLKRAQKQVAVAEHRARQEPSPEAQALCDKLKVELNNKALEVFRCRSERYPNNLAHKFELGVCLARARNYTEAIKVLQEARADPKRKGLVLYRLGTCFEAIKQYKLAMSNYAAAVTETGERDEDHRKAALYSAGRLAMQLQDWEAAEKYLTDLAGLDFGYRDVAERLDNLTKMREDGASP